MSLPVKIPINLADISTLSGSDSLHTASSDIENLHTNIPIVQPLILFQINYLLHPIRLC